MSTHRSGKRRGTRKAKYAPDAASAREGHERRRPLKRVWSWLSTRGPVFRFVILLGAFFGAFNVLFYFCLWPAEFFEVYLGLNAKVSAVVLRVLGQDVSALGKSLGSSKFSLSVEAGCDALQSSAYLVAAVLASPVRVSLAARVPYLILGTLFLLVLNIVRLVSLYFSGAYYPRLFDVLHIDFWQAVFILLPLVLWLAWVRWALRKRMETSDVPA